jgi:uncharacterized membrane protein YhaH (DUF805 family)
MTPIGWALRALKHYADFNGRAPRAEYWWYALFVSLTGLAVALLDFSAFLPIAGNFGPLTLLFMFGLVSPGLAVTVRRLHDTGRSGWWCALKIASDTWVWRGASTATLAAYENLPAPLRILFASTAIVCGLTLLTFTIASGSEHPNRYGPDPYGPDELEEVFA